MSFTPRFATADDLHALAYGFREARIFLTALEFDLFTALDRSDSLSAAEVAAGCDASPRGCAILLDALAALTLVEKQDGRYRLTDASREFLSERSPGCARASLLHQAGLWKRWNSLTEAVRTGASLPSLGSPSQNPERARIFMAAMHYNSCRRAKAAVEALELSDVRRVLDIGGGSGAYVIAMAQAHPHLQAAVLDNPTVCAIAREHIAAAGLADRVRTIEGDAFEGTLPAGFDLVFMSSLVHIYPPRANQELFRRVHAILPPGGRLAVQELILTQDHTAPLRAVLLSVNMLVATEEGSCYSAEELGAWMREAGFADPRRVDLEDATGLVMARKN